MNRLLWVLAACSGLVVSTSLSAVLTPGQKMAAEALVKQFGAADFDTRQKAVDRLVEMGPDVAPVIRKALADTVDNEVKLRCEMVMKQLRDKFGAAAVDGSKVDAPVVAGPTVAVAGDFPPSKITLDVKNADLSEVLAQFAKESGNTRLHAPDKWDGEPITLNVKDMPYWQALDKLCATAGHVYYAGDYSRTTGMGNGMGLLKAVNGHELGDCTGPVAVKLVHGMEEITLRGVKSGGVGRMGLMVPPGDGDMLTYSIDYYWEDRLPVLADDAQITRAVGPNGKLLKIVDNQRGMVLSREPKVKPFMGAVRVTLTDLPDGLKKIDELDGIVKLTYGGADKTLRVEDVLNATGKTVKDGDISITIVKVEKTAGGIDVIVKLQKGDKEYEVPVYPGIDRYGFTLVGEDGQTSIRGWVRTSGGTKTGPTPGGPVAGGGFGVTTGVGRGPGRGPQQVGKGESGITFQAKEGQWTLVYTYVGETWSKDYPFKLVNVPLP